MLIDLHCHTRVHSPCSALTPEALARAAAAAGLDAVCVTEHDAAWGPDELARAFGAAGLPVFRGMEVTTEVGHVLVFGLDAHTPEMNTLEGLRRVVRDAGALMYLAHPGRRYGTLPPDDLAAWFNSVESHNGTEGALQDANMAKLAAGMRLPGIGGSDCHSVREVGVCATEFSVAPSDQREFVEMLAAGGYAARRLR